MMLPNNKNPLSLLPGERIFYGTSLMEVEEYGNYLKLLRLGYHLLPGYVVDGYVASPTYLRVDMVFTILPLHVSRHMKRDPSTFAVVWE